MSVWIQLRTDERNIRPLYVLCHMYGDRQRAEKEERGGGLVSRIVCLRMAWNK